MDESEDRLSNRTISLSERVSKNLDNPAHLQKPDSTTRTYRHVADFECSVSHLNR
jgi:hypothetical protein